MAASSVRTKAAARTRAVYQRSSPAVASQANSRGCFCVNNRTDKSKHYTGLLRCVVRSKTLLLSSVRKKQRTHIAGWRFLVPSRAASSYATQRFLHPFLSYARIGCFFRTVASQTIHSSGCVSLPTDRVQDKTTASSSPCFAKLAGLLCIA
jgi:hypothetical protein